MGRSGGEGRGLPETPEGKLRGRKSAPGRAAGGPPGRQRSRGRGSRAALLRLPLPPPGAGAPGAPLTPGPRPPPSGREPRQQAGVGVGGGPRAGGRPPHTCAPAPVRPAPRAFTSPRRRKRNQLRRRLARRPRPRPLLARRPPGPTCRPAAPRPPARGRAARRRAAGGGRRATRPRTWRPAQRAPARRRAEGQAAGAPHRARPRAPLSPWPPHTPTPAVTPPRPPGACSATPGGREGPLHAGGGRPSGPGAWSHVARVPGRAPWRPRLRRPSDAPTSRFRAHSIPRGPGPQALSSLF